MRTVRAIAGVALMVAVFAAASVSAQQAAVGQTVQSLAGKWIGWLTPTSGSNVPIEVDVKPDGSYTSKLGASMGTGNIKMADGKFMAEGHIITGSAGPAAGAGTSQLTVTSKDGKQMISGAGRDQQGPYNFQLTKQQ